MRLYHSSNMIVEHPDTQHSRRYLDFGRGFYLTTIHEQAVRYAQRFKRRGQSAWLNIYELSDEIMSEETLQIMKSEQCTRIIINISEMFGVSLQKAADIYYGSETANLIEEGVADLHCRSDKYLAEEIWNEYQEKLKISKDFTIDDTKKSANTITRRQK